MSTVTLPFSGGCACGAIRYECAAEPLVMVHCHCRDCQRTSGGAFSSLVVVGSEAYKLLQGSPHFHATASEMGGKTRRAFCADCGSPLSVKPDAAPQITAIMSGSLDHPGLFRTQVEVWTSDAHPGDPVNSALPNFPKYPPS